MDGYKKIIRSQKARFTILRMLKFVPDEAMLKLQYRIKLGRKLNLKNPARYSEKIQWYKLNYRDPLMTQCADKYRVREYVESKGFGHILNELYQVAESSDGIDFDALPEKFVLKTTNGSETNIFCKDKSKLDILATKKKLNEFLLMADASAGREWAYDASSKLIIAEKFMEDESNPDGGIPDYKFFCFNGHVAMMWVDYDRFNGHKRVLYNPDGTRLNVRCTFSSPPEFEYPKEAFETLMPIAENLAEPFPHARIDLYYVNRKPFFGEITFYSGSGYEPFDSDAYDFELGRSFALPAKKV